MRIFHFILLLVFLSPSFAWAANGYLDEWMELESFYNDKAAANAPSREHSNLDKTFRADGAEWFDLKTYWVPESELDIAYLENATPDALKPDLIRERGGRKEYRLLVHPKSEKFYKKLTDHCEPGPVVHARATASSRTLLVRFSEDPSDVAFVKVSLDVELGNVVRTVPKGEAARSIGISKYTAEEEKKIGSTFQFLPETLGLVPKGWDRGGQIVRPVPEELLKGNLRIVPLFSLTAPGKDGKSLFEKMVKQSGEEPYEFTKKHLLRPFLKGWADWAVKGGLVMEAHSQNVLLQLDSQGNPQDVFYHRDAGGMNLDFDAVDAHWKNDVPVFSELGKDYHQNSRASARLSSLDIYFKDRFLFNIDRDLARIDPKYKRGRILSDLWPELSSVFHEDFGVPLSRMKESNFVHEMDQVIHDAAIFSARSGSALPCGKGFGKLLRGLGGAGARH